MHTSTIHFKILANSSRRGTFLFAHHVLPLLLAHKESSGDQYPPTLIFTGATASVKGSAQFGSFAASKWAARALSQSLAREFGPQGVHVAHAVIDGPIDIPGRNDYRAQIPAEAKIDPDAIAQVCAVNAPLLQDKILTLKQTYWKLHTQSKRCFVFDIDIRTSLEKW